MAYQISELAARASLHTVYYQYEGESATNSVHLKRVDLPQNKVIDMLDHAPIISDFFLKLEKKDKRFMLGVCQILEYKYEQLVIKAKSPVNSIFFVIKGELVSMNENGPVSQFA
jgi:hypothetical protein